MRAAVVNPHAWMGSGGGQRTARPTRVNGSKHIFCTFPSFALILVIRVSVFVLIMGSSVTLVASW